MERLVPALLALLVVSSGCAFVANEDTRAPGADATPTRAPGVADTPAGAEDPPSGVETATSEADPTATPTPASTPTATPRRDHSDPDEDVLGWERGYWHDEPLAVDGSDGLNDSEFAAAKARAMARVEVVRGLEFHSDVEFEFTTREELQFPAPEPDQFSDAYWEAAFVVGEDRRVADAYAELYDVVVDGVSYGGDRIVMVVADPEEPSLDTTVLSHELVHAVESQNDVHAGAAGRTGDAWQARSAVVEGSAMYYEGHYVDRCGAGWDCIEGAEAVAPPDAERVNMGLYVDFAFRYTVGERFVAAMAERGDGALDRMRRSPPASTEQVIHPERFPDDEPARVRIADRNASGWERVRSPRDRTWDRLGEQRLYAMLWNNGVVETDPVEVTVGQQVPMNYSHPATDGWAGDRVVVYANGSARGYVFASTWDSERDARQFQAAYLEVLAAHGAERVGESDGEGVYVIEEGSFADAYRVTRTGDRLVVVNAPTVAALDDVHAPAEE